MNTHPVYILLDYTMLAFNITITVFCFGAEKRRIKTAILIGVLVLVFNIAVHFITFVAYIFDKLPTALLWILFLNILNKGHFISHCFYMFILPSLQKYFILMKASVILKFSQLCI